MLKKIISIVICATVSLSIVGCGKINEGTQAKKSEVATEEKYDNLEGPWAENTTLDALKEKFNNVLKNVEEKTKENGIQYSKEESVEDDNDETVNKTYLYLDNPNPEKNKLESLYYGMNIYGSDLSSGQITMKLSLNFDGEKALNEGKFNLKDTSIATYAEFLTGVKDRDYSEINQKIIDILKSEKGEGVISDSINGLYEEVIVNKEYIVYKLETKKFDFSKASEQN